MKTIHKYNIPLDTAHDCIINMPSGAQVLSTGFQDTELFIWALVDPDAEKKDHYFQVFGTGHEVVSQHRGQKCGKLEFVGHARLESMALEFFVFQRVRAVS
jgi:hypothetical protein